MKRLVIKVVVMLEVVVQVLVNPLCVVIRAFLMPRYSMLHTYQYIVHNHIPHVLRWSLTLF